MFFNHEKSAIRGSTSLTLFRLWWWRLHSSGNVPVIRRQPTTDKLRLAADTIWLVSIWRKKKKTCFNGVNHSQGRSVRASNMSKQANGLNRLYHIPGPLRNQCQPWHLLLYWKAPPGRSKSRSMAAGKNLHLYRWIFQEITHPAIGDLPWKPHSIYTNIQIYIYIYYIYMYIYIYVLIHPFPRKSLKACIRSDPQWGCHAQREE